MLRFRRLVLPLCFHVESFTSKKIWRLLLSVVLLCVQNKDSVVTSLVKFDHAWQFKYFVFKNQRQEWVTIFACTSDCKDLNLQACKSLTELTPGSSQKVILLKSNSWKSIPLMKTNLVRFLLNDGESFSGTIFFFFGLSLVRIPQTIFFRTFLLTGFACSILFLSLGSAAKAIF